MRARQLGDLVNELQVAGHARNRLAAGGWLPQEHGEVI